MALLPRPPISLGAGSRAAVNAAQMAVPYVVRDVASLLRGVDPGAIPLLGGRSVDIKTVPLSLLGGTTLARAKQMHEAIRDARLTRKNLWYIRITDPNPPKIGAPTQSGGIGGVSTFWPSMSATARSPCRQKRSTSVPRCWTG